LVVAGVRVNRAGLRAAESSPIDDNRQLLGARG
jgi:hypothetical protein